MKHLIWISGYDGDPYCGIFESENTGQIYFGDMSELVIDSEHNSFSYKKWHLIPISFTSLETVFKERLTIEKLLSLNDCNFYIEAFESWENFNWYNFNFRFDKIKVTPYIKSFDVFQDYEEVNLNKFRRANYRWTVDILELDTYLIDKLYGPLI